MKHYLHALLLTLMMGAGSNIYAQSELFISEYIEGSSNNKAIEIFNGTGQPVNLGAENYNLQYFFNGSLSAGLTINLTGSVADGDVFIIAQSSADPVVLAQADQTNGAGWYNGNDVVVLRKGTTILDAIGQIGTSSEWGSGLTSTQDNTLRRKSTILVGDVNPNDVFDPAAEWDGFAINTYDGLGNHTVDAAEPFVVINEVLASHTGTDDTEYVELYGTPGKSLEGLSLLVVEGDAGVSQGTIDFRLDFTAVNKIGANGFFLVGNPAGLLSNYGVTPDIDISNSTLENSSLTLALVETSSITGSTVSGSEVVSDAVALTDGGAGDTFFFSAPVVGPDGSFFPAGARRVTDGVDTDAVSDWVIADFGLGSSNTPTASGIDDEEEPELLLISAVQGSGDASPLVDQVVIVEGIVVGDFQENDGDPFDSDLDGFFLQEEAADYDNDPLTSEGIFVFAPNAADVSPGDLLRVTGKVVEFNGLTELTDVSFTLLSSGLSLPAATEVNLPASVAELEAVEGMYVTFPQSLVISEYFNFDRFGEVVLALPFEGFDRLYQPTSYADPSEAPAILEEIAMRKIMLDDARTVQNPDPARHPNGQEFTLDNRFRGGDLVQNTTGVLNYSFNTYRIQPTEGADYEPKQPRPEFPEAVGGTLKVMSFNVLNYFNGDGLGGGFPTSRGADNLTEFQRQEAKIVRAILSSGADIIGLIEIENDPDGTESALDDLTEALNAEAGEGVFDYIRTGIIGTDEIKVALLYKPAKVMPQGDFAILTTEVDDRFADNRNRPALAQTFRELESNGVFTAVVNHFKSKGSGCGDGDDDPVQGNCNFTRTLAAQALVDWLATDPTASDDNDFLILGDLNAYDEEDPIQAILKGADDVAGTDDDYVDLAEYFQGEFSYSYLFDGLYGHLDYALAIKSLAAQVSGATEWHINADEPDILDYDTSFKRDAQDALYEPNPFRASDHDPVIVGLALLPTVCAEEPVFPEFGKSGNTVPPKIVTFPTPREEGITHGVKLLSFSENQPLLLISREPITTLPEDGYRYTRSELFGEGSLVSEGVFAIGTEDLLAEEYAIKGLEAETTYYLALFVYISGDDCGPNYLGKPLATASFKTKKAKFYKTPESGFSNLEDGVLNVYPNPVKENFYINIPAEAAQEVTLLLRDMEGNAVSLGMYSLVAGDNKLEIDIRNLSLRKNLYLLNIEGNLQSHPVIRISVE
jgi:predicted extracellular nuclease